MKITWQLARRMPTFNSDQLFVYDLATNSYQRLAERMPIGLNDLRTTIAGITIYAAVAYPLTQQ